MTAEAGKWPIERARKPGHAILVASGRGTAPLVRAVEKPDSGEAERRGNRFDVPDIGRVRALQPAARERIHGRKQHSSRPRQEGQASIPQRARPRALIDRMADGAAFADIQDRDGNRHRCAHRAECLR